MDIERTKQFYRELKQSDLCGCAYCRNYVKEAAKAYPAVDGGGNESQAVKRSVVLFVMVSFLRRQAAALLSASRTRAAKTKREIK